MKSIIALLCLIVTLKNSYACLNGKGYLPENNLSMPVEKFTESSEMSEEIFTEIIDQVSDLYAPEFKSRGWRLDSNKNWKSDRVNARASRDGRNRIIVIYGGFARHPFIGKDELALVTCHEIGHHLGGAPLAFFWASSEGQADYFSTAKCTREYFKAYPIDIDFKDVPQTVVKKCNSAFTTPSDQQICLRSNLASLNISKLFAELQGRPTPSFNTPDSTVVRTTNYRHPVAQCRLDNFLAASLCEVDSSIQLSSRDYRIGACHGGQRGSRSPCWFSDK